MSAPPDKKGTDLFFAAKNRSVPFLLLLAGCHSAPEPRPAPPPQAVVQQDDWDGSGGASTIRNRGDALANYALTLRGIRYRFGGATPDGFDCSGLVFFAHRHFGLEVPRTSREQSEEAESVKERKLQPGDLVFFKIDGGKVNHVGIYIGKRRFVHAPGAGKPVTVNSLDDEFYAATFSSAGRYWDRLPR
jgi:cell wall-associated NlpC family hydrolase